MFVMSLRKGQLRVSLQYRGPMADGVLAQNFVAEIRNDTAVLSFELKPGSDDEHSDVRKLDSGKLTRVAIHDTLIAKELAKFCSHSQTLGLRRFLEVVHRNAKYKFCAEFEVDEYGSVIQVGAPSV